MSTARKRERIFGVRCIILVVSWWHGDVVTNHLVTTSSFHPDSEGKIIIRGSNHRGIFRNYGYG